MRVLIRTYPPTINPNYGGILQAWALQQAIADLGHTAYVDATKSVAVAPPVASLRKALTHARDSAARAGLLPQRFQPNAVRWAANRELLEFSARRFNLVDLYRGGGKVHSRALNSFDAFVVGSDQVWRPDFVDVGSYLLDFLPTEDSRPRIAYAASFGSSSPRPLFEESSRTRLGALAHRFDAVSVREESGIELCEALWGVAAERLIDPTMLLSTGRYAELAGVASTKGSDDGLATYILDSTPRVSAVVSNIAHVLGTPLTELFSPLPQSYAEFSRDRGRYSRVTIEGWLRKLTSSSAIITDSYHGTVFAILFNKPFLVVLNHRRGLARFETLLGLFGLEGRIAELGPSDVERIASPIDWGAVNAAISYERERGRKFLERALPR